MSGLFEYVVKKWIEWKTRPKNPFTIALILSGTLLATIFGLGRLTGIVSYKDYKIQIAEGDTLPANLITVFSIILLSVFILSFVILCIQFYSEKKRFEKKSVIVVEARGLRDDDGNSLIVSLEDELPASKTSIMLDLRQIVDGEILHPELLLPKITTTKDTVNQARHGTGHERARIIYGGLAAVPLTFLTGVELDDEGRIIVYDWDRTQENWRALDDEDDNKRFVEPDFSDHDMPSEVVLAVSVSYVINQSDLQTTFDHPIVNLVLEDGSFDCHWSIVKQNKLATQFVEFVKKMREAGVTKIHLVLAAPNSVSFNFGRRYDKRNLPDITVYQYDGAEKKKYPWGVRMPVGEAKSACIERT